MVTNVHSGRMSRKMPLLSLYIWDDGDEGENFSLGLHGALGVLAYCTPSFPYPNF